VTGDPEATSPWPPESCGNAASHLLTRPAWQGCPRCHRPSLLARSGWREGGADAGNCSANNAHSLLYWRRQRLIRLAPGRRRGCRAG
jgi:hypothetical protein